MPVPTVPREPSGRARQRDRADGGFILVTLGLLIIPIIAFTALAVDVSSWYSRATELQRSADAAALGGVVWMPDFGKATTEATKVLATNNVVSGSAGLTATINPGSQPNSLKVCVTDSSAPQYFSSVFSSPESLTRCGTARYNLPLQIGSPLNYIGGNGTDYPANPGQPFIADKPPYGPSALPPGGDYTLRPDNYTAVVGTTQRGCVAVTSNFNAGTPPKPHSYGYWWSPSATRTVRNSGTNYLDTSLSWTTTTNPKNHYATELQPCSWSTPFVKGQEYIAPSYPIRQDMDPGFWASIEAPGTDAVQGDMYAPQCYGAGWSPGNPCGTGTSKNPNYDANGYYYTLRINAANPLVMLQVFDAAADLRSSPNVETGDTQWASPSTWYTHYELLAPDNTPFDPTDNLVVSSGTCGGGSGNNDNSGSWNLVNNGDQSSATSFKNKWHTLCTLTAPTVMAPSNNSTYFLRVWTTGGEGNATNAYALRAVATNSTAVDVNNYPFGALPQSSQPTLAVWAHMSIFTNIRSGSATFFLAKVTPSYEGKTLVMSLYDSGEGATSVTVNTPQGPQMGCTYSSAKLANVTGGGAAGGGAISPPVPLTPIGASSPCTISTGGRFNGDLLTIKMPISHNAVQCDENLRPAKVDTSFTNNGCWWSITYATAQSDVHDNTTWAASIEGDPVRLIQ